MVTKWSVPRSVYGRAIKGTLLADILDRGRPALGRATNGLLLVACFVEFISSERMAGNEPRRVWK